MKQLKQFIILIVLIQVLEFLNVLNVVEGFKLTSKLKNKQEPFKRDRIRKKLKDDKDGIELYQDYTASKAMYRPQESWFINVMLQKPNEKIVKEAEDNGYKYQIESLQENLDRDYYNSVRDYYDQKLETYEQKLLQGARLHTLLPKQ